MFSSCSVFIGFTHQLPSQLLTKEQFKFEGNLADSQLVQAESDLSALLWCLRLSCRPGILRETGNEIVFFFAFTDSCVEEVEAQTQLAV